MRENLRLLFSLLWFPAVGGTFAGGMVVILTWGEYLSVFLWSAGLLALCTAVVAISTLE